MKTGYARGYSPILVTAALSVAILFSAVGIHMGRSVTPTATRDVASLEPVEMPTYLAIADADANGTPDWQDELARSGVVIPPTSTTTIAASSSDPLSDIGATLAQSLFGGYQTLKEYNAYTPERGEQLADAVAENLRAPVTFVPHTVDALTLVSDNSLDRSLRYRADMRVALAPLITDEEPEFALFARYIETGDATWLGRLTTAAGNYSQAEKNALAVVVPQSAAPEHLRVTNALGSYAETLLRMVRFANDPIASMALLRTYNERERESLLAFDALAKYYVRTVGNN